MTEQMPQPKPKVIAVNAEGIPAYLKKLKQFVMWKLIWTGKRWDKIPFGTHDRPAKNSDPTTWCTFDEAIAAYKIGAYDGIGFCFSMEDGLAALDLDHAVAEDGTPKPWARELLSDFAGTFIEKSPGGGGYHIWTYGDPRKPDLNKRWSKPDTDEMEGVDSFDCSHHCYLTITGVYPDEAIPSDGILDCSAKLAEFRKRLLKPSSKNSEPTRGSQSSGSGDVDLDKLRDALRFVPGGTYDEWFKVGLSLKMQDAPFWIFDEWSQSQPGYQGREDCEQKWEKDLKPNGKRRLGSIFHTAKQNGWTPKVNYGRRKLDLPPYDELLRESGLV